MADRGQAPITAQWNNRGFLRRDVRNMFLDDWSIAGVLISIFFWSNLLLPRRHSSREKVVSDGRALDRFLNSTVAFDSREAIVAAAAALHQANICAILPFYDNVISARGSRWATVIPTQPRLHRHAHRHATYACTWALCRRGDTRMYAAWFHQTGDLVICRDLWTPVHPFVPPGIVSADCAAFTRSSSPSRAPATLHEPPRFSCPPPRHSSSTSVPLRNESTRSFTIFIARSSSPSASSRFGVHAPRDRNRDRNRSFQRLSRGQGRI